MSKVIHAPMHSDMASPSYNLSFQNGSIDKVVFIGDSIMMNISTYFRGCNTRWLIAKGGNESWKIRKLLFRENGQLRQNSVYDTLLFTDLIIINGGLNDGDHELYGTTFGTTIFTTILNPLHLAKPNAHIVYIMPFKRDQFRASGSSTLRELSQNNAHIHIIDRMDCGMHDDDFENKIHPTVVGYSKICVAVQRIVSTIVLDMFNVPVEDGVTGQGIPEVTAESTKYDLNAASYHPEKGFYTDEEDVDRQNVNLTTSDGTLTVDADVPSVPCLPGQLLIDHLDEVRNDQHKGDVYDGAIEKARVYINSLGDVQAEDVEKDLEDSTVYLEEQRKKLEVSTHFTNSWALEAEIKEKKSEYASIRQSIIRLAVDETMDSSVLLSAISTAANTETDIGKLEKLTEAHKKKEAAEVSVAKMKRKRQLQDSVDELGRLKKRCMEIVKQLEMVLDQ